MKPTEQCAPAAAKANTIIGQMEKVQKRANSMTSRLSGTTYEDKLREVGLITNFFNSNYSKIILMGPKTHKPN